MESHQLFKNQRVASLAHSARLDSTLDQGNSSLPQMKPTESNYDLGQNLHKQTVSQPHFKLKLRPGQEYQIKARESVINSFRSSITSSID
jgi:hypothetical protein